MGHGGLLYGPQRTRQGRTSLSQRRKVQQNASQAEFRHPPRVEGLSPNSISPDVGGWVILRGHKRASFSHRALGAGLIDMGARLVQRLHLRDGHLHAEHSVSVPWHYPGAACRTSAHKIADSGLCWLGHCWQNVGSKHLRR